MARAAAPARLPLAIVVSSPSRRHSGAPSGEEPKLLGPPFLEELTGYSPSERVLTLRKATALQSALSAS